MPACHAASNVDGSEAVALHRHEILPWRALKPHSAVTRLVTPCDKACYMACVLTLEGIFLKCPPGGWAHVQKVEDTVQPYSVGVTRATRMRRERRSFSNKARLC